MTIIWLAALLIVGVVFVLGFLAGLIRGKDVDIRITNKRVRDVRLENSRRKS